MYIKVKIVEATVITEASKPVNRLNTYPPKALSAEELLDLWEDPRMTPVKTPNIRYVKILSKAPRNVDQILGKFLDEVI